MSGCGAVGEGMVGPLTASRMSASSSGRVPSKPRRWHWAQCNLMISNSREQGLL